MFLMPIPYRHGADDGELVTGRIQQMKRLFLSASAGMTVLQKK
jgi:hypothetical protein